MFDRFRKKKVNHEEEEEELFDEEEAKKLLFKTEFTNEDKELLQNAGIDWEKRIDVNIGNFMRGLPDESFEDLVKDKATAQFLNDVIEAISHNTKPNVTEFSKTYFNHWSKPSKELMKQIPIFNNALYKLLENEVFVERISHILQGLGYAEIPIRKSSRMTTSYPTLPKLEAIEEEQKKRWEERIRSYKENKNPDSIHNQKIEKILSNFQGDNLKKLDKIVEKYFNHKSIILEDEELQNKTCKVLEKYDCYVSIYELCEILKYKFNQKEKNQIFKILKNSKNNSLQDYVKSFMEINASNYGEKSYILEEFLLEENIRFGNLSIEFSRVNEQKDLENFERNLFNDSPIMPIENIDNMSGTEFEEFLEKLFTKMDYKVERIGGAGDQGGDLILDRNNEKIVVQAKRSSTSINNSAVQEVIGAIGFYNCAKGIVVTSNIFNKSAQELANANNIELVDRTKLLEYMKTYF